MLLRSVERRRHQGVPGWSILGASGCRVFAGTAAWSAQLLASKNQIVQILACLRNAPAPDREMNAILSSVRIAGGPT